MADRPLLDGSLALAGRLDARFFALLEAIDATGSISRAARAAGYSYRGAWMLLDGAANLANAPLLESVAGGRAGGGTRLTPLAHELIAAWRHLAAAHDAWLREHEAWLERRPALAGLLRKLTMRTSARNQFAGTIVAVESGPVSTQVTIALRGAQSVVASITTAAARELGAREGVEAIALIKASEVVLVTDFAGFALSARNQWPGTVSRIERGAVSTLVCVTLPGGAVVTASVTNDAVRALGLEVGAPATAACKASAVMVAVARAG